MLAIDTTALAAHHFWMQRTQLIYRMQIIAWVFVLVAITMISKSLIIVLDYSYSITGASSALLAFGLIALFAHVVTRGARFIHKVGPRAAIELSAVKREWQSYSTLTKVLVAAGLTNLPDGVMTLWHLGGWFFAPFMTLF